MPNGHSNVRNLAEPRIHTPPNHLYELAALPGLAVEGRLRSYLLYFNVKRSQASA